MIFNGIGGQFALECVGQQDVIILDDSTLKSINSYNRITLLEIIEDRHNNGSIIVISQIPEHGLYDVIGEKTITDAILDRLIHQSHQIELHAESLRKKRGIIKVYYFKYSKVQNKSLFPIQYFNLNVCP